jgi:O-antigen/teichoic acid export membrane protein
MLTKTLVYLGSNILNALIPLALLPILTRFLTVAEYGQVGLFQTLITAFAGVVGLNAASATGRRYFDDTADHDGLAYYIGAAFQVLVASMVPILAVAVLAAGLVSEQLDVPVWWVVAAALVPAFNAAIQLRLVQWQVRGSAFSYGGLQVSYSAVNLGLSLLLVISIGLRGEGRVIAQLAAGLLLAATALILLRRDRLIHLFAWRPEMIREILAYGLPLVPHVVGLFLLAYADRLVIGNYLGLEKAGMYIAAMQLVGGASLVFDAINKAYIPWLYERLARDDAGEKGQIVRYTYAWFALVGLGVALAFVIGPPLYVFIAGERYVEAAPIIGWIALGQGLSGMYLMVTNYVFYSRRTGILAITTMASAVVGISALLLLVPRYGLMGAAIAFCIVMGVSFVLTWWASHLRHPKPWLAAQRPCAG